MNLVQTLIDKWRETPSQRDLYRGRGKGFNGPAEPLRGSKSPACTDRRAAHSSRHCAALRGTPPAWAREPTPFAASAHSPAIDPPTSPRTSCEGDLWGDRKHGREKSPALFALRHTTHPPAPP